MKTAVLGSGGWGTALAMLLAENGHSVTLWSFLPEESEQLRTTGENPLLPGVRLPAELSYTSDLSCVRGSEVVVMATPSFGVRATAEKIRDAILNSPNYEKRQVPLTMVKDFREAVLTASHLAEAGDTVLLSPACASFDAFKNFEERGNTFRKIVMEIE